MFPASSETFTLRTCQPSVGNSVESVGTVGSVIVIFNIPITVAFSFTIVVVQPGESVFVAFILSVYSPASIELPGFHCARQT